MKNPTVLILGINGMVGREVYNYLHKSHQDIFGTSRNSKSLKLTASSVSKDLKQIFKKIKRVDYVINCIGLNSVDEKNKLEAIKINSQFPVKLSRLSAAYNFKLIHVSTDGVFSKTSGKVNELDTPSPSDTYGITKLLGESLEGNSTVIRTSLIGLSPKNKKGLIEFVKNSKTEIDGFENQIWSGCTTLQFAKFVESLIYDQKFFKMNKSKIIHFAPLGPISKFELVKEISKSGKLKNHVNKTCSSVIITRYLSSRIISKNELNKFGRNLHIELDKIIKIND